MSDISTNVFPFYKGWDEYQRLLVEAVTPLTPEQLELGAAANLRSIRMILTHIIAVRARWFYGLMGEGGPEMAAIESWDREGEPVRSAAELVSGLENTWQMIQNALSRWTAADLEYVFRGTYNKEDYALSRQWVIWHVIEHDLHHGGEVSFSLGMHGLKGVEI